MFCKNCGTNMGENANICPNCGTNNLTSVTAQKNSNSNPMPANPLIGKEYDFSGNILIYRAGVRCNVRVDEDRLYITKRPAKKKNDIPVVMLDDILAIKQKFHMRTINIIYSVLMVIAALNYDEGFWLLIFPVLHILFYRERKIEIYIRNGQVLTIYSDKKNKADEFVEDMSRITKIQN